MKKPIPFGKYLLLERVNVGGMAEVFKAKAFGVEGFERLVALKRILPSIAEDQEFITMFIDEAKISVQLTHANIASIFDLGKVADSYFIAMEFVRGKDMRAIFDRLGKRGQSVPVSMASYVVMKVCEGLDYAHNKRDSTGRDLRLVHRDVSPQNILVSYDGEIKLIDFGIAKAANKAGKTQAGILKGKFGYMSPEQVRGLPLDRRSDVFAMGICLYELLTGERLFVGESDFSTLEKVRNVEIMPPSTYNRKIPEELEQIVLKALAKDVEDRYQTAMDLHDDLQSFMYTSGNFFARKDLAGHMRKMWSEEIQKEEIRDEQYRHVKAPPPIGSRPPPTPPPPPRQSLPAVSKPPPPPPAPAKRTLLGQGPLGGAPSSTPSTPAFDMDWDEDELATQIYDKPEDLLGTPTASTHPRSGGPRPAPVSSPAPSYGSNHGDLASAQTAAPRPSFGSAAAAPMPFSGASAGQPAPFDTPAQPSPFDAPSGGQAAPSLQPREPTAVTQKPQEEKSKKGPILIAAAVALLIILGAAFAYWPSSPGTIVLTTQPAGAVVFFDDAPIQAQSNGTFVIEDVTPDTVHLVSVRKTDFESSSQQVQVTSGELRTMTVVLESDEEAPTETGFALTTVPPGATVFVDGRQLPGTTPIRVTDLSPGSHTIRAELSGRAAWQRAVEVAAGAVVDLDAPLGVAEIATRFRSEPSGASVTLVRGAERVSLGRTPLEEDVDVSGERWTVEMSLRGHDDWSEPLRIPDGRTTLTITAQLERAGRITTNMTRTMYVRPPDTTVMNPVMTPVMTVMMTPVATGTGTVDINTRPWSEVYIDGRRVGNTPQRGLTLSSGRHRIRFVNPDFNISVTKTITVRAGENTRVIETLSPN
ncbi:MAG: protein kinase [Polyangiales bacterium]